MSRSLLAQAKGTPFYIRRIPLEQMYHFFMTAIQIQFTNENGEEGMTIMNQMIQSETNSLTVRHLANVQQGAMAALTEQLGSVPKINNMVFLSMNYLGENVPEIFFQTHADAAND